MAASLRITLLGPPAAEGDGARVQVDTRKATALLAYLAITGQPHGREALADLLWPESDPDRARAALRRTLSTLKAGLPEETLETGRDRIALTGGDRLSVDVYEFERRLAETATHGHAPTDVCTGCVEPLALALDAYGGDFMSGFALRDSVLFDDWQSFQSDRLRRELAGALERLARARAAAGDSAAAVELARRRLALDPLNEGAHRALMRAYAWSSQRGAALEQYRECVRVLDGELGVAPVAETSDLYHALLEGSIAPPVPLAPPRVEPGEPSPDEHPAPVAPSQPPLVGRAAEWATLLDAYAKVGPDGRLLVLEGEAGIGKTRLAQAFLAHAAGQGAATIETRSHQDESGVAYWPIVAALRGAMGQAEDRSWLDGLAPHALAEASRVVPELAQLRPDADPPPPLDGPGAQTRFFDAVGQVLLAACARRAPGVVFFDDLQWADEASIDLIAYLVRRLSGRPLLVLASWRSEDVQSGHRLRRLLAESERAGVGAALRLGGLGRDEIAELARSLAPESLPETHERLFEETDGVPFFVVEYLSAIARGAETQAEGDWPLPGGVRDLLRARLADLAETGVQVLASAAAIGRSFEFDTLRATSGRSEDETVLALEELVAHGLIEEAAVEQGSPAYDFRHDLVRALVYDETSLARRRLLHRRVAAALEAGRSPTPPSSLIARHYRLAGDEEAAARHHETAGAQAAAVYANAEALAHFEAALALGHPAAGALHERIGDLHTLLGHYAGALSSYEVAAAQADPPAVAALEHKLAGVHHRRGDFELAERHFDAALALLDGGTGDARRTRVLADRSLTARRQGHTERAWSLACEALELAQAGDDVRALAQAHNMLGALAGARGDGDAARRHLEHSLELADRLGDGPACAAALNNLALALRAAGELEPALAAAQDALALCAAQGDRHREAALHNNIADLLHDAGRSEEAMTHLKQAVALFAEIGERDVPQPEVWKLVEW